MILACDVGGTSTRLAVFEPGQPRASMLARKTYPSRSSKTLEEIASRFLSEHPIVGGQPAQLTQACFGVAGPVVEGRCITTNLPWMVDLSMLRAALGIAEVYLINDLVANAWGIDWLAESEVRLIHPGRPDPEGNRAVIAPGTGLGEAGMIWTGNRHLPFASEGGHAEFGPRGPLEYELAQYLERKFGRVSYEHVLSGPGLVNVYIFLRDTARGSEPDWLTEEMQQEEPAACISRAAISGRSPLCEDALRIFLEIFGQESGNLALKLMATGGVWLGGGIVPKIVDWLVSTPHFLEGFTHKGKLSHVVEKIPVYAISNSSCALLGAARYASEQR